MTKWTLRGQRGQLLFYSCADVMVHTLRSTNSGLAHLCCLAFSSFFFFHWPLRESSGRVTELEHLPPPPPAL